MDRETQRQNKRNLESSACQESYTLSPDSLPTGRPAPACGTAVLPAADSFSSPAACPNPAPTPVLSPTPLAIGNITQTAFCPTAPGYPVTGTTQQTVVEYDQQQLIYFQTLDGITNNQLNYLYEIVPSSSAAIISAALSGNTATVKSITKLTDSQLDIFIPLVQTAQFNVDTLAVDKARNGLACQAYNDLQVAACPTGSYTGSGVPSSIPYTPTAAAATASVYVGFTLKSSTGDQAAFALLNLPGLTGAKASANAIALAEAQKQLKCVYTNELQLASCCTGVSGYVNNLGYVSCVPNDILPVLPALPLRVGATGVAADTIFSTVSQEDANSVALTLALSNLNCYFPNEDCATACSGTGLASQYPIQYTDLVSWNATNSTIVFPEPILVSDVPLNTRLIFPGSSAPGGLTAGTIYYVTSATGDENSLTVKLSGATASHTAYENGAISFLPFSNSGAGITASLMVSTSPGKYAYILRGEIIETDVNSSSATATANANAILATYLDCFWTNDAATAVCPTASFVAIDGQAYTIPASQTASAGYTSTIAANGIVSYISKADANYLAAQAANAGLQCSYCNQKIDPVCTPYPDKVWLDSELPLSNTAYIPNCWSINATSGMPSETVCDFQAASAQNTALSITSLPLKDKITLSTDCCYASKGVTSYMCASGAIRNYEPSASGVLTSKDGFYLPEGTIVLCSTAALPVPTYMYEYSNLYITNDSNYACCTGISACVSPTGWMLSVTGSLWAYASDLFTSNAVAVSTLYTSNLGTTPYSMSADARYVVRRPPFGTYTYKDIVLSGATATSKVTNLNTCDCNSLTEYTFFGTTYVPGTGAGSLSSSLVHMFCGSDLSVYTKYSASGAFSTPGNFVFYDDSCGLTAWAPFSSTAGGATGFVFGGITPGSNYRSYTVLGATASPTLYTYATACPSSRYPYTIHQDFTRCATGATAVVYTSSNYAFTTDAGLTLSWYTTQFDDSSIVTAGGTGFYYNWIAPDSTIITRLLSGTTSNPAEFCISSNNKVTVYYSTSSAKDVCSFAWSATQGSPTFNDNIRTLWASITGADVFSNTGPVIFYTSSAGSTASIYYGPGGSGATTYIAPVNLGYNLNSTVYRLRPAATASATLENFNYAALHKLSPFQQSVTGEYNSCNALWRNSTPNNSIDLRVLNSSSTGQSCVSDAYYSDVKNIFSSISYYYDSNSDKAKQPPAHIGTTAKYILNDGFDVPLGTGARINSTDILLTDSSRLGALTGGIIIQSIASSTGFKAISDLAVISSLDLITGQMSLTGPDLTISPAVNTLDLKAVGFVVSCTADTTSFTCSGPHCGKLQSGHLLYMDGGATGNNYGYITRQVSSSVFNYTGSIAGGLSAATKLYVYGKYYTRLWPDDNKTSSALALNSGLSLNTYLTKNWVNSYFQVSSQTVEGEGAATTLLTTAGLASNTSGGNPCAYYPHVEITGTSCNSSYAVIETSTTYECNGNTSSSTEYTNWNATDYYSASCGGPLDIPLKEHLGLWYTSDVYGCAQASGIYWKSFLEYSFVGGTAGAPIDWSPTCPPASFAVLDIEEGAVVDIDQYGIGVNGTFSPFLFDVDSNFTEMLVGSGPVEFVPGDTAVCIAEKQIMADDIAQNLVNSFVQCYFYNTAQTGVLCTGGLTLISQGYVEAGTFVSTVAQWDADRIAKTMADALTVCSAGGGGGGDANCSDEINSETDSTIGGDTVTATLTGTVCSPTLTLSVVKGLQVYMREEAFTMKQLTICDKDGNSFTGQVPFYPEATSPFTDGATANIVIWDESSSTAHTWQVTDTSGP